MGKGPKKKKKGRFLQRWGEEEDVNISISGCTDSIHEEVCLQHLSTRDDLQHIHKSATTSRADTNFGCRGIRLSRHDTTLVKRFSSEKFSLRDIWNKVELGNKNLQLKQTIKMFPGSCFWQQELATMLRPIVALHILRQKSGMGTHQEDVSQYWPSDWEFFIDNNDNVDSYYVTARPCFKRPP